MDTFQALISRRSIRNFSGAAVSKEVMIRILKAGMYAPSARNTQAWKFIVVEERKKLEQLARLHPYGKMLNSAGAAILVCGDMNREDSLIYQIQNCSAATQNILLAAHDLGLGTVWLGVQPRENRITELAAFFNLPAHIIPISMIAVGHPVNGPPPHPDRFSEDRIVYEEWTD